MTQNAEVPGAGSHGLFRRGALEAAESRFGVPIRQYGVTGWALTAFMGFIVIAVVAFLCVTEYARKETVTGSLTPARGSQRLVASRSGVIEAVLVQEGSTVDAGTPLIRISHDSISQGGESISSLLETAAVDQAGAAMGQVAARLAAIDSQMQEADVRADGIRAEIAQLSRDRQIVERRLELARESASVGRVLFEQGLMARLPLSQREETLLNVEQQDANLRREQASLQSQLLQLSAQRSRLDAERADSSAAGAQQAAQIAERRASLARDRGQLLTAAMPGRLAALQARPGGYVQQGQSLGAVVPTNSGLEAELWVPSRSVGFLERGAEVRLQYDAFPYQKFGVGIGRVSFVSQSPAHPADISPPIETAEPLYRVIVHLDRQKLSANGRSWDLTPGMRLTADLVLEKRTLMEWALNPLLSAVRRNPRSSTEATTVPAEISNDTHNSGRGL